MLSLKPLTPGTCHAILYQIGPRRISLIILKEESHDRLPNALSCFRMKKTFSASDVFSLFLCKTVLFSFSAFLIYIIVYSISKDLSIYFKNILHNFLNTIELNRFYYRQ